MCFKLLKMVGLKQSQGPHLPLWACSGVRIIRRGLNLGPTTITMCIWWGHGIVFSVAPSRLWNSLPQGVTQAPFLLSFHKQVKIFFFRQAFLQWLAAWVGFLNDCCALKIFYEYFQNITSLTFRGKLPHVTKFPANHQVVPLSMQQVLRFLMVISLRVTFA